MTRRDLFRSLVAVLPVAASVRIEPEVQAGDLVVVHVNEPAISDELAARITAGVRSVVGDHVKVLVIDSDARLDVHRGVARIEGATL